MKKNLIVYAIVAFFLVLFFLLFRNSPIEENENKEEIKPSDFQKELVEKAIEEVGQPIEGFDAFLLLAAFSGLYESDFDEVKTFEGVYEFKDGELLYKRTSKDPVTSAEKTISNEGYKKLLENISKRLNLKISDAKSLNSLIKLLLEREEGKGVLPTKSFITNFEECVAAGNPVLESYPRQCRTPDGNSFTEAI